ncbi:MAG: tail fiber domain-containing protein, partial [Nanoarchaeota archaeon]|nr:tail fiber domain-containing protein [Nanoarchaeota archaeon]
NVQIGGGLGANAATDVIFYTAANTTTVDGTEAMRIKSGNVGIGTTTPQNPLNVVGNLNATQIGYFGSRVSIGGSAWDGSLNVRVGSLNQFLVGGGAGQIDLYAANDTHLSGAADLRIIAANVGINRNPSSNDLEVEGTASKTSSGDWLANSDMRIKTNIQTVSDALDTIMKLNPVIFNYNEEYMKEHPSVGNKSYYNFIAQEFQKVFPDDVKGSGEFLDDGSEILQLDSYPAQVIAIKAIQELAGKDVDKEERISGLEKENRELRKELESLKMQFGEIMGRLGAKGDGSVPTPDLARN